MKTLGVLLGLALLAAPLSAQTLTAASAAVTAPQTVAVTAGQVVLIGGTSYAITPSATGSGPPALVPFQPVTLGFGDHVTLGANTYTVTPQLTLVVTPGPVIGQLTDGAGQVLAAFPLAAAGQVYAAPMAIHGTGFGSVLGSVNRNGEPEKVTGWSDGEVDVALIGSYTTRGWLTLFRPDGQWDTAWLWP